MSLRWKAETVGGCTRAAAGGLISRIGHVEVNAINLMSGGDSAAQALSNLLESLVDAASVSTFDTENGLYTMLRMLRVADRCCI